MLITWRSLYEVNTEFQKEHLLTHIPKQVKGNFFVQGERVWLYLCVCVQTSLVPKFVLHHLFETRQKQQPFFLHVFVQLRKMLCSVFEITWLLLWYITAFVLVFVAPTDRNSFWIISERYLGTC